jgi:formyl-CoA transferase
MSVNGDASTGPLRLGTAIVDMGNRTYSAIGILMALHERERSGQANIRHDAYDCGIMPASAGGELLPSTAIGRWDRQSTSQSGALRQIPTKTCDIFIASGNNGQFRKMAEIIGRPELADDPRFADNGKRAISIAPR